jgi:apolipoprotein N-acyltransferase
LSFPKFGHPACAWVALAPLLVAVARACGRAEAPSSARPLRRAFLLGLASGLVYFAGALYWLVDVMVIYGGLAQSVALAVAALLVTYLAMYPAIFALIVGAITRRVGSWALALAPAVWVATELGRETLLSGFPWALLGTSQATLLPIAQLASVVGVYGVSALVVIGGAGFALAIAGRGPRRILAPASAAILILIVAAWGRARIASGELTGQGTPVRVGIVQGNFSQDIKWEASLVPVILDRYLRLSAETIDRGAQLVVWPEASVPFYFLGDPGRAESIRRLARAGGAHMLLGSDEYELGDGVAGGPSVGRIYNSALMLRPDGELGGVYRKMHLVPFGEYVPLKRLLFFVAPLVQAVSDFSAGDRPALLQVGDHRASAAICYEVIYPGLMRRFVREGSELLTTITNDAWFGRSSAAYQHFEQASIRAIEQGRYLVRAANTGISGVVDPYGRVLERTRLFETSTVVREVRFLQGRTFYNRIGDAVAYLCLTITAVALLARRRTRSLERPASAGPWAKTN